MGELCPVPSSPSAHAVASARAARPPSSGGERFFQSVPGSLGSAIARWQTGRSAQSDPRHRGAAEVRGAALRGPCRRPAGRQNLGRRLAARRVIGSPALCRAARAAKGKEGGREGGSAARPVLCSPRRPRCPLTCSDRLGSAAACGAKVARAVFSEVLYPGILFVAFAPRALFSLFLGQNFRLVCNNPSRFWQYLKIRCSRDY